MFSFQRFKELCINVFAFFSDKLIRPNIQINFNIIILRLAGRLGNIKYQHEYSPEKMAAFFLIIKTGCFNDISIQDLIDVDMDLPRDHPDFMRMLDFKAGEIVKYAVIEQGSVDFIHTRD